MTVVEPREIGADDTSGTAWHPSAREHYTADGLLPDLDAGTLEEHLRKPEADDAEGPLAAEDSVFTPDGVV